MTTPTNTVNSFLDKYYTYIAILIVIGIITLGVLVVLWPQYKVLQQSGVLEYQTAVDTLEDRQQYLNDLKTMEANYEVLDKRLLTQFQKILPDYSDASVMFAEFESMLNEAGLEVLSINIAEIASEENRSEEDLALTGVRQESETLGTGTTADVSEYQVTVNAVAKTNSYQSFKTILYRVENYNHLLDLNSIAFSAESQNMTLIFRTYQKKSNSNE